MTQTTITQGFLEHDIFKIVSQTAAEKGVKAYVIGGYVRDCFLGRSSKDIDIVVEGSGIDLAEAVAAKVRSNVSVFRTYGTAMLRYKGVEIEFVGARKESYGRGNAIVEDGTLQEDQLRRDFTINAMAFSLQEADFGALVDPFGGIRDLAAGIIRTPMDPEITFGDDPLRMVRAVRFATRLGTPEQPFRIAEDTLASIRRNKARLADVPKERIVEELNKILLAQKPSIGFRLLDETGLLDGILPQLSKLKGVETVEGKGHKENFSHTLEVLDNVAVAEVEAIAEGRLKDYVFEDGQEVAKVRTEPYVWLRWAALLHDIAKPLTKKYDKEIGWSFHGHEIKGAKMTPKIFAALKLPLNEKMKYVQKLISLHLRPIVLAQEEVTDSAVRRLLFDAGDDIDDLMILCDADITSKNEEKRNKYHKNFQLVRKKLKELEEKDHLRNWQPPVNGEVIMTTFGITEGRNVGIIKTAIREAVLDGIIGNNFEEAYEFMKKEGVKLGLVVKQEVTEPVEVKHNGPVPTKIDKKG